MHSCRRPEWSTIIWSTATGTRRWLIPKKGSSAPFSNRLIFGGRARLIGKRKCSNKRKQFAPDDVRGKRYVGKINVERKKLRLVDQEIVFLQFRAFHLFTHPDRRHATAGPENLRVLARAVFRLRLLARAFSRPFRAGDCAKHLGGLGRREPGQLGQFIFQIGALL